MKPKKTIKRTLEIFWIVIGIFFLVWTGAVYIKMNSPTELGIVEWGALFSIGCYALILYSGITILLLLIKLLTKIFWRRGIIFSRKIMEKKPEVFAQ